MHAQSSTASIRLSSKPCRHYSDSGLLDNDQNEPKKKRSQRNGENDVVESRLRFAHGLLKDQFCNVEATYEGSKATFEIITDSGLESTISVNADGKVHCNITIEIDSETCDNAKISTECIDQTLASNIHKMLKNALTTFMKI